MNDPTKIPIDKAAELLSEEGKAAISTAMIEADVAAGAPTNPDGTLNLVHYAAWILLQGD